MLRRRLAGDSAAEASSGSAEVVSKPGRPAQLAERRRSSRVEVRRALSSTGRQRRSRSWKRLAVEPALVGSSRRAVADSAAGPHHVARAGSLGCRRQVQSGLPAPWPVSAWRRLLGSSVDGVDGCGRRRCSLGRPAASPAGESQAVPVSQGRVRPPSVLSLAATMPARRPAAANAIAEPGRADGGRMSSVSSPR